MFEEKAQNKKILGLPLKQLIYVIGFGLLLYTIIPLLGGFQQSLAVLATVSVSHIVVIILVTLSTYFAGSIQLKGASDRKLPIAETFMVQIAGAFINIFVPAGLGHIGSNIRYLITKGSTLARAQASLVLTSFVSFLITSVSGIVILLEFGIENMNTLPTFSVWAPVILVLVLLVLGAIFKKSSSLQSKFKSFLHEGIEEIKSVQSWKKRLFLVLGSVGITLGYALTLHLSITALGLNFSFIQSFAIYTISSTAGSVSPTPGGLGGREAAYVAGLILFNVSPPDAIAITLLFRLATFWFTLLLGAFSFYMCKKKNIL